MKTRNLLKLFTTMVAVMMVSAAFGQHQPWDEMTGSSSDSEKDSLVIDMTVPYYVEPDNALNNMTSAYDPTSLNSSQGINSTFNWSSSNGDVSFTEPSGDADAPYREVSVASTGTDIPIQVTEVNEEGCEGTTTENLVDVISKPSFTIGSNDMQVCEGAGGPVQISTISSGGDGISGTSDYYFVMDVYRNAVDSEGNDVSGVTNPVYSANDTVVIKKTTEVSTGPVDLISNYTFKCHSYDGKKRITEYVFDFSTNNGGDDIAGVNHHISRKGDFLSLADAGTTPPTKTQPDLSNTNYDGSDGYPSDGEANYTWFTSDAGTITVTVYPEPSTGTIYHVPNTYER